MLLDASNLTRVITFDKLLFLSIWKTFLLIICRVFFSTFLCNFSKYIFNINKYMLYFFKNSKWKLSTLVGEFTHSYFYSYWYSCTYSWPPYLYFPFPCLLWVSFIFFPYSLGFFFGNINFYLFNFFTYWFESCIFYPSG